MQKPYSAKFSQNRSPLYDATGSVICGNRPESHGNRPDSTTMPPSDVPCPPMNFVAECRTMSAPCSIGRHRYGVAIVLSTTRGRSAACATSASPARSAIEPDGFPITSV